MTIVSILILVAVVAVWYEIFRTREYVIRHCQRVCKEANLQFLDQSVAVISVKIRVGRGNVPELYRIYQFEYSEDGMDRLPAYVDLINNRIQSVSFTGHEGKNIYHH